jgi:hypothetical protein
MANLMLMNKDGNNGSHYNKGYNILQHLEN